MPAVRKMKDDAKSLGITPHLAALGDILAQAAGDGFDSARVKIEVDDGWSRMSFFRSVAGHEETLSPSAWQISDADDIVDDIKEHLRNLGSPDWTEATLEVFARGEIQFDLTYKSSSPNVEGLLQ